MASPSAETMPASGSCRASDVDGFYQSGPLVPGTDYIPFVLGRDTAYRSETWDGRDCPWNWCDLNTGATLEVGGVVGNQTGIDFHVVQGERELASDNRTLGRFKLGGIPPMPAGMPRVAVRFHIDVDHSMLFSTQGDLVAALGAE